MNTEILDFCDQHDACREGQGWALSNCSSMAKVWETAQPDWLVWVATRLDVIPDLSAYINFLCREVDGYLSMQERAQVELGKLGYVDRCDFSFARYIGWYVETKQQTWLWSVTVKAANLYADAQGSDHYSDFFEKCATFLRKHYENPFTRPYAWRRVRDTDL